MTNVVKAQEFQLVDPVGRTRVRIFLAPDGKPTAEVFDSTGQMVNRMDLQKKTFAGPAPQQPSMGGKKETLSGWHSRIYNEVRTSEPRLSVGSYKLYIDFVENNTAAGSKYLNEILEIRGEIVEVSNHDYGNLNIGLKGISNFTSEVLCYFTEENMPEVTNLKPGQKIRLKGKCTEYTNKRVKVWGCQLL
ncbi:OB-fold protein [Maridesulfovibrio bastinii]|uniref:OB-fold protein n=1 Tax=Maridesulfovibrio bastinii TaxID=47157 RepID=UPI0004177ADF|nr:hypothetical protein [Maridesulfovibrio bastinii]